jgi:riboflavin biosynthesis pyrimidine reductase
VWLTGRVRQIFSRAGVAANGAVLTGPQLAELYAYPRPLAGRWLRANMVTSLDGAATVRGRSGGLSGEADQQVFALLRAMADVILVGAGTVRAEQYGPVRPESEGVRWAWLREGRSPSASIAVITRKLDLDTSCALLTEAPGHAQTIVITTEMAPPRRRAAAARSADVIVAGDTSVDLAAAVAALAERGYRNMLNEGGPHLLSQLIGAGLVDELCLTVSPLLAGPGAGRIVQPMGPAGLPGEQEPAPLTLTHVISDEGYLLCRYQQLAPAHPPG